MASRSRTARGSSADIEPGTPLRCVLAALYTRNSSSEHASGRSRLSVGGNWHRSLGDRFRHVLVRRFTNVAKCGIFSQLRHAVQPDQAERFIGEPNQRFCGGNARRAFGNRALALSLHCIISALAATSGGGSSDDSASESCGEVAANAACTGIRFCLQSGWRSVSKERDTLSGPLKREISTRINRHSDRRNTSLWRTSAVFQERRSMAPKSCPTTASADRGSLNAQSSRHHAIAGHRLIGRHRHQIVHRRPATW